MPRQILLVDPCPLVPVGLGGILKGSDFQIATATDSVAEAIDRLNDHSNIDGPTSDWDRETSGPKIELVVCDFVMSDGSSLQLQTVAQRHQIPLVLISHHRNPEFTAAMIDAGAKGLIPKSAPADEILAVLEKAAAGEATWQRKDIRQVTGALSTTRLEGHIEFPLTQREFDVLKQVAAGQTNKMIAEKLGISYETVKEHVQRVINKLSANDRTQAALAAVRAGLL